ncbi:uncharacterized protein LOC116770961 [Danaus plexippus]|uniref:uncharacterized protein LOC116770961 n=1 Tax=Danaus plexippus TaxID=13037 RepID=UPI002AAFEC86|nr:uncharacterized protein LOC116770961 [Danaus plexippus]
MCWKSTNRCLCLPLRHGLVTYGYFGLVVNYLSILHELFQLSDCADSEGPFYPSEFIKLSLTFSSMIINLIFHIILVAGLHRKSRGLLEVFYGYQSLLIIIEVIVSSLYLPLQIHKNYQTVTHYVMWLTLVVGIPFIILLLLQVYLITKIRSYINTLEDLKDGSYEPAVDGLLDEDCTLQSYNRMNDHCDQYELGKMTDFTSI